MPKFDLDRLARETADVLSTRAMPVLASTAEDSRTRRVTSVLFQGSEIGLQPEFGFHLNRDATLSVTYTLVLRWPRAEQIHRDLRPTSPYDEELPPEVLEIRRALYPIAQLRITEDLSYFPHPSPMEFESSEAGPIRTRIEDVADILVNTVLPEFSRYCEPRVFADLARLPERQSRLLISPDNAAIILALAARRAEFLAWADACRRGERGKEGQSPAVLHLIERLTERLPQ
jgi:hypothetical protein